MRCRELENSIERHPTSKFARMNKSSFGTLLFMKKRSDWCVMGKSISKSYCICDKLAKKTLLKLRYSKLYILLS
jgi:hypothetical protein